MLKYTVLDCEWYSIGLYTIF